MKKKYIAFTVAVAVILITFSLIVLIPKGGRERFHTAVITVDGEIVRTVDLDSAPDETFTVESERGYNTVIISGGEIYVSEASCPDKVCVDHGALKSEYLPIVCLPNRLMIELK